MKAIKKKLYEVKLIVNKEPQVYMVPADEILTTTLRERGGYTSVKRGCDNGECGACTVIMNGKAVPSCIVLSVSADGAEITTVEGLSTGDTLDPIQEAFIRNGAVQCGFCTPGMILTAKALLDENPAPTDEEITEAIQNNFCRCTGYISIMNAIKSLIP